MLVRIERIRSHIAAAEIADEISYCVRIIRHAIDRRPDKVYLGPCQTIVEGAPCKTQLYAPATAEAYDCPQCGQPVNVAQRRQELLALIADQVGTVGTCCQVLAMFGLEVKADTIQNWARAREARDGTVWPPRIWHIDKDLSGAKMYRVGDVVTLVHEAVKIKANRQQRRKSA
jgi:predicted Rdx family selenoprotein